MSEIYFVPENETSVLQIPANVLLAIFSYLDFKSLCLTSRVCRLWHTYANDSSLWRILDLRSYQFNLRCMWKIITRKLTEHCKELYIEGYLSKTKKLVNLSTPLMQEIKKKAPRLSNLTLYRSDLNNIDVGSFPTSITKLSLAHSLVPLKWFDTLKTKNVFPFIQDLDLSFCTRISSEDITNICCLHTLKILTLNGCYRVVDDNVRDIATKLNNIVSLDVSDCKKLTDTSLHHIARNLKSLEKLCLRNCHMMSTLGLASLKDNTVNLNFLDLVGCSEAARNESLKIFAECRDMIVVTQDVTQMSSSGVDE